MRKGQQMTEEKSKQSSNSIDATKTIWLVASFFCLLIAGFYVFFYQTQSYLSSITEKYAHEISEKNKGIVDDSLDGIMKRLKSVALMIDEKKLKDTLLPILNKMEEKGLKDEFQAIRVLVINKNGDAITGDGLRSNFSHRQYFIDAMNGRSNISQNIYDIWSGVPIHVFATPITTQQKAAGVAAITLTDQTLGNILQKSSTAGESFFYVIQKNGDIISQPYHKGERWLGQNIIDIFKKAGANDKDINEALGVNGFEDLTNGIYKISLAEGVFYFSTIKSKYNDWYVVSIAPDSFVATWYKYFPHIISAVLIVGFLLFGSFFLILKSKNEFDKKIKKILFDDPVTGAGTLNSIKSKYEFFIRDNCANGVAIIAFDVMGFKILNLSIGRDSCDQILRFIADSASRFFGCNALIARTSADNFIIVTCFNNLDDVLKKIDELSRKICSNKLMLGAKTVFGIYLPENKSSSIEECIDRAELAKISSKLQKKMGGFHFSIMKCLIQG